MTANQIHEKYPDLWERYDGEDGVWYKKGAILRGYELGEDSPWEKAVIKFLDRLVWLKKNRNWIPNPDYNPKEKTDWKNGINCHSIRIDPKDVKIEIFQIKEKFGEVTCYIKCSEHIESAVAAAKGALEAECGLTCYSCGKLQHDMKSTKGWITYICDECHEKTKKSSTP